jgi:hypothetical protein
MRVKSSDEIDAATVARWLAQDWALPGVTVVPHHGGMNSRTWIVSRDPSHWIAKAVPSAEGRNLSAGLSLATRVQAAGIPAGAPLTTPDGRPTVTRHGWTLALLTFVDGAGLFGKVESEQRLIGATLALRTARLPGSTFLTSTDSTGLIRMRAISAFAGGSGRRSSAPWPHGSTCHLPR